MSRIYYERLPDESAAYLEDETSRRRSHTAMILVFESGPLGTDDGGVRFERIREIVEQKLSELPRLRTRLRTIPVDGHPIWVDDQEFNLDYHLRQSSLPRPGTYDQLCRTAARIGASRLDRSRPLWDCWVIEGLENNRFALVLKMHKALAHLEGADLLRGILSANEDPVEGSTAKYRPRPSPSPAELFGAEVLRRWSPSRRLIGRGLGMVRTPGKASRELQARAARVLKVMGYKLRPASESPFDGNLGPHRSYSFHSVDLGVVQGIRQSLGGSVHDIVLTIVTGALRRVVEQMRVSPTTVDLRGVTPILGASGEDAFPWVIELPVWEEAPEARFDLLVEQTSRIRAESDVATGEMLTATGDWNASRLFAVAARALKNLQTGQIPILQSPGPREPLFLDGARLVESYGILPLQDSGGLGITVIGYAGSLFFSFNVDPDLVDGIDGMREAVDAEVEALSGLAAGRGPALRAVGGGRH